MTLVLGPTDSVVLKYIVFSKTAELIETKLHIEHQLGFNQSLFLGSGSHNQDGHRADIW